MGTGRGEQRLSPLDHLARVGIRHAPRNTARVAARRIGLGPGDLQRRHVRIDLPFKLPVPDRGDPVVHQIVESRHGEVVPPGHILGRKREVVARLGFQIGISINHEDIAHVEVHMHLLERRGTEPARIGGTERAVPDLVHRAELRRKVRKARFGEVVEAHAGDEVELPVRIPVELREGVGRMLRMAAVAGELVGHQVVAQVVAADGEDVFLRKGMVVERAQGVLHVAVIAHVARCGNQVVALVVLVEGIGEFQIVGWRHRPIALQPAREAAVAVSDALRSIPLAKEVTRPGRELQSLGRGEDEPLLDVERRGAVDGTVIADLRIIGALREVDGVDRGVLHVGRRVEPALIEPDRSAVTLFVVGAVAAVQVDRPRLLRLAADDVHHAADGIRPVERRDGPLDDLDAPDVVHVQAAVIHVVERLARQPLAVDKEQHRIAAEARHVERHLLVHRVGELDAGQLALQQIADMRRIDLFDIRFGDDTGDDRDVFQQFGRAGGRHHHLVHHRGALRKPEIQGAGPVGSDLFAGRFVPDERGAERIGAFAGKRHLVTPLRVGDGAERRELLHGHGRPGKRPPRSIRYGAGYSVLSLTL